MLPNCSSTGTPGSHSPATSSTMRCRNSLWLASCSGRSTIAAADTSTEHTRLTPMATNSVLPMLSLEKPGFFSSGIALHPASDVGTNNEVVNERRENVAQQDRQHDAFRERRVDNPDHPREDADQESEYDVADHGVGGAHGVGGH